MKKNLLLIAALAVAGTAAAQTTTAVQFSKDEAIANGFAEEGKVQLAGGVVVNESAFGTVTLGADDEWGWTNTYGGGYSEVTVGKATLVKPAGPVGTANPKGMSLPVAMTAEGTPDGGAAPTSGAFLKFKAAKNGIVTWCMAISSRKNYYVYEGEIPVGFTVGGQLAGVAEDILANFAGSPYYFDNECGKSFLYAMPENSYGYLNVDAEDAATFLAGAPGAWTGTQWPGRVVSGNPELDVDWKNTTCFLQFRVYADNEYSINGQGTKPGNGGYLFTEYATEDEVADAAMPIVYMTGMNAETGEGLPTVYVGGSAPAGINSIAADAKAQNDAMFNVYGQRVNENYKGLVIKNGVKYYNK